MTNEQNYVQERYIEEIIGKAVTLTLLNNQSFFGKIIQADNFTFQFDVIDVGGNKKTTLLIFKSAIAMINPHEEISIQIDKPTGNSNLSQGRRNAKQKTTSTKNQIKNLKEEENKNTKDNVLHTNVEFTPKPDESAPQKQNASSKENAQKQEETQTTVAREQQEQQEQEQEQQEQQEQESFLSNLPDLPDLNSAQPKEEDNEEEQETEHSQEKSKEFSLDALAQAFREEDE